MSKRRHKAKRDTRRELNNTNGNNTSNNFNRNNRQGYNNGPFGINPNALLSSMFGNIDMNQINSLLQSMNTQGFDFNNFNLGNLQNLMGAMNGNFNQRPAGMQEQHNNDGKNIEDNEDMDEEIDIKLNDLEKNDENIEMLRAIRSIVPDERKIFIDKIIKLYNDGKIE